MSDFKFTASRTDSTDPSFRNSDAWTVRITNPRGETMQRKFYMGYGLKGRKPTLAEVMECLITDAACVADTDLSEFTASLGYADASHARKAYNACRRTADRLETFLTEEERESFINY